MITPSDLRRRPSRSRDSTESSGLHWLRAKKRITFKLCLLVNKAINGLAPSYLQDLCVPVTTVYARSALRSAARWDVVPRTRRRLGNRAFCVAGPTAWNSLPPDIRTSSSLITFKNLLKTHWFIQSSKWKRPLKEDIRDQIRLKKNLWRTYVRDRDNSSWLKYTKQRNKVKQVIKNDLQEKNRIAEQYKSNPKTFWKYVNSKSKHTEKIGDLKVTD